MSTAGLMPDPDVKSDPVEGGEKIIDQFITGEISLEEFVGQIPVQTVLYTRHGRRSRSPA
jgi:hypothetical protein